jgi:membrane-associated phospholipid phosphatase
MSRSRPLAVVSLACVMLGSGAAGADPTLRWNPEWKRVSAWNVAATGAMAAGALALQFGASPERQWTGGILFDVPVRDALRPESEAARKNAGDASDYLYFGMFAYPLVVDSAIVAWAIHGSSDVAAQTFGISAQSLAASGLVVNTALAFVGRQRPARRGCENRDDDPACDETFNNQSFFSGHTAISFTTAGLLCTHHAELPLYGGGWPDVLACVASLGTAATVGTFRIMSDRHYATDVLTGATVGLTAGIVLPRALHYGFGTDPATARISILPIVTADVQGIGLVAAF